MNLTLTIITTMLLLLINTTQACHHNGYKNCVWHGDGPYCGETDDNLIDMVGGWTLVDWTKDKTLDEFRQKEEKGWLGNCRDTAGTECMDCMIVDVGGVARWLVFVDIMVRIMRDSIPMAD